MATTPEGWIKKIVKEMLDMYPRAYWHMPVQNGMGAPSLDFICCIDGQYVAIETKAPGKRMTDRQELTAKEIEGGGGEVIRDVGTTRLSIDMVWSRLNPWAPPPPIEHMRWHRWYTNAEGKDARKPKA